MAEVAAPSREPSAAGPVVTGTSGQREPSLRSTIACFFGFYGLVLLPALCTLGPLYMLWKGTLLTKTIAVILIVTYYRYVFDGAEHKLGWDVPWFYNVRTGRHLRNLSAQTPDGLVCVCVCVCVCVRCLLYTSPSPRD